MAHSVLGKHVSNAHHPTLNGNTEGNISQHWKYSHKARYDLNTDSNSPWLRRPLSLHEMKMSRCHLIAGEWPWIIWLSHSPQGTASWLQEVEWDLFCLCGCSVSLCRRLVQPKPPCCHLSWAAAPSGGVWDHVPDINISLVTWRRFHQKLQLLQDTPVLLFDEYSSCFVLPSVPNYSPFHC